MHKYSLYNIYILDRITIENDVFFLDSERCEEVIGSTMMSILFFPVYNFSARRRATIITHAPNFRYHIFSEVVLLGGNFWSSLVTLKRWLKYKTFVIK